ncbi:VOC family protein [Kineococcus gynurae]|uniref:VOC family protein n=1 Tax=Kineococcus gynurae TaxID=452979 RepID=A0ABV5LVY9_9ACTN
MARMIFVNLPVADKERSKAFFTALGFALNPGFEDEGTACVVLEENIVVLVHTPEKWQQFLKGEPAPSGTVEVMLALSAESKDEAVQLKERALAAGGSAFADDMDFGYMYGTSWRDPDGHVWEASWMDPAAIPG